MKSLPPLRRAVVRGKMRRTPGPRRIPFRVFIGYSDVAAARHATDAIGDVVRSSGRNVEVQPMLWRFQQLSSSYWHDRAIAAALDADVIVLASSTSGPASHPVEGWVNAFLTANRGRRATLIALSGPNEAWTITVEHPRAPHPGALAPRGAERERPNQQSAQTV